jgi:hypothetical protein
MGSKENGESGNEESGEWGVIFRTPLFRLENGDSGTAHTKLAPLRSPDGPLGIVFLLSLLGYPQGNPTGRQQKHKMRSIRSSTGTPDAREH